MKKRSILFSVVFLGIISVGLSACKIDPSTSSSESETFTITWKNHDGTVLEVDNDVPHGTLPTYDGIIPAKSGDSQFSYAFSGWSPEVVTVTDNATYTAQFTNSTNQYLITFKNHDGESLQSSNWAYGATPVYSGTTPVKDSDSEYSYAFSGWSPAITSVAGSATYTAQFTSSTNLYTVTWKNHDGAVLEVDNNVPYGTMPTYDGTTPTKSGDSEFSYAFSGWSPSLTPVTKEATYVALFAVFPLGLSHYTLATDADFTGNQDGEFVYVGTADYVIIPEKIRGITITIANENLFSERRDIAGVAFQTPKNITSMAGMFYESISTSLDLSNFDTSNVADMSEMFYGSQATSLDLSSFDTSNVTDMSWMFYGSNSDSLDLSDFDTSNVTDMSLMFYESQATSLDLSNFDTSKVTDMSCMFYNSQATSLDLSSFDTSNVTGMAWMFAATKAASLDVSNFDTSKVIEMHLMFAWTKATSLDLSNFDTSNVTNMNSMFSESQATSLDLSSFDTSKVTNMGFMFVESQATSLDLSSFDTSQVTTMICMFGSLKATSLDLSNFDTSKVVDMQSMFRGSQVTSLDLSNFDTSNVWCMQSMFAGSQVTFLDLSGFDTSKVTHMGWMFEDSLVTSGYARNEAEAEKFNDHIGSNVFIVKP